MRLSDLQELGLDCVAWNPSVYHDLLRSGDGTAEGIVAAYFGMVRSRVPTNTLVQGCCTFLTSQVCKSLVEGFKADFICAGWLAHDAAKQRAQTFCWQST